MERGLNQMTRGIGGTIGAMLLVIIGAAAMLEIVIDLVAETAVGGTTGMVLGLLPLFAGLLILVFLAIRVQDYVR